MVNSNDRTEANVLHFAENEEIFKKKERKRKKKRRSGRNERGREDGTKRERKKQRRKIEIKQNFTSRFQIIFYLLTQDNTRFPEHTILTSGFIINTIF